MFILSQASLSDSVFAGCSEITLHICAPIESLVEYCEGHNIAYDFQSSFPKQLTLNYQNGDNPSVITVNWLDPLPIDLPLWNGHIFSGWFEDEELLIPWTGATMPAHDLTLFAGWDINIFTLSCELNGGLAEVTNYRVCAGDIISIYDPVKEGYCFVGWSIDPEGSVQFNGIMPSDNLTIYAQWVLTSANGRYQIEENHATLIGYSLIEEEDKTICLPEKVNGVPLTTIAANAFSECELYMLYIPSSVTSIELGAFSNNNSLVSIHIADGNPSYKSIDGVVYSSDGSQLLFFPPAAPNHLAISIRVPSDFEDEDGSFGEIRRFNADDISAWLPAPITFSTVMQVSSTNFGRLWHLYARDQVMSGTASLIDYPISEEDIFDHVRCKMLQAGILDSGIALKTMASLRDQGPSAEVVQSLLDIGCEPWLPDYIEFAS